MDPDQREPSLQQYLSFVDGLYHLASCPQGSSMSYHVSELPSFLQQSHVLWGSPLVFNRRGAQGNQYFVTEGLLRTPPDGRVSLIIYPQFNTPPTTPCHSFAYHFSMLPTHAYISFHNLAFSSNWLDRCIWSRSAHHKPWVTNSLVPFMHSWPPFRWLTEVPDPHLHTPLCLHTCSFGPATPIW